MPKIPENAKRVPLNCLVRPDTKQEIEERAVNGKSQGQVIDEAVSALYRETGTAYDVRDAQSVLMEKIPNNSPEGKLRTKLRKEAREINARNRVPGDPHWKGPLLKPNQQRKEHK